MHILKISSIRITIRNTIQRRKPRSHIVSKISVTNKQHLLNDQIISSVINYASYILFDDLKNSSLYDKVDIPNDEYLENIRQDWWQWWLLKNVQIPVGVSASLVCFICINHKLHHQWYSYILTKFFFDKFYFWIKIIMSWNLKNLRFAYWCVSIIYFNIHI